MSRETINLICAELPGAERESDGGTDLWSAAHEPFARVEADGLTVSLHGDDGWAPLGPDRIEAGLREPIVAAYLRARDRLPEEVKVTLDRTSG